MRYKGKHIKDMSYEEQLEMVQENGSLIRCIKEPTDEMISIAIDSNPFSIRFIDNPSELIQVQAVKNNVYSIRAILYPCKDAQLIAIKGYSTDEIDLLSNDISNPCEEVFNYIESIKSRT